MRCVYKSDNFVIIVEYNRKQYDYIMKGQII